MTGLAYFSDELAVCCGGNHQKIEPGSLRLTILNWKARKGQPQPHFEPDGVRGLDIHRESRLVAWITGHAQLKLWRIDRPDKYSIQLKKTAKCVALSPDGLIVAVAVEWAILTFSTSTRFPLQELKGHKGKVTSIRFTPDGSRIVSGSWDETVREWDVATGKELRSMNWKIGQIAALSYAPDGTRIAAGSTSGKVIIWDVD
jgi:WD40 repeat protein